MSLFLAQEVTQGLNAAGWLVMSVCIGLVLFLVVFCFYKILTVPDPRRPR